MAAIVAGGSNGDIAHKFAISAKAVKHHLTNVFNKIGVSNRLELALFAVHRRFNGERFYDGDEALARLAMDGRIDVRRLFDATGTLVPIHDWPDDLAQWRGCSSGSDGRYPSDARIPRTRIVRGGERMTSLAASVTDRCNASVYSRPVLFPQEHDVCGGFPAHGVPHPECGSIRRAAASPIRPRRARSRP